MSSKVIAVYKTVQVSSKRVKTEVCDDITPSEGFILTGGDSPYRVNTYRYDENEELGFRTHTEQENIMIEPEYEEFDYDNWVYITQPEPLYKSYSPRPIRNTKMAFATKKLLESERLAAAMRKMMRGTQIEPNSPVYDYWNDGYAKVFDADIRKAKTWEDPERTERKRKLTHGECEKSCHWCVNEV